MIENIRKKPDAPEVLAPAGDFERLEAAVLYGADAVYCGGNMFGMRAAPQNFNHEQLKDAVEYCHKRGVRLYLTCNTLPTNKEVDFLDDFIKYADEIGVDAIIVADIGVLMKAKHLAPNMDIHISTQAGVVNYLTARELYNLGAKRVVLAREVPIDEIKVIRDKTPSDLEIEAFVHGAMCMSFSGRCLISQYLVGRDANRGQCAQPCRWNYHLVEEKRPGQYFPIFEDDGGTYILNAQDMSLLPYLDKLKSAGITSFKIEGRAKSAYYVAVIANAYRQTVDILMKDPDNFKAPQWLIDETEKVSHRQYSTGFYFKDNPPKQYYESGGYVRNWDVVAKVVGYEGGYLICSQRNKFWDGDTLEVLEPGCKPVQLKVTRILDEQGNVLEAASQPMRNIKIPSEKEFTVGSIIRKEQNS